MKKGFAVFAVVVSIACCAALCACGQTIKGSPATVVKACQDLSTNDKPTIEVTGDVTMLYEKGSSVHLKEGDYSVWLWMSPADEDKERSGRTTFKGTLYPDMTDEDSITVKNATIVE